MIPRRLCSCDQVPFPGPMYVHVGLEGSVISLTNVLGELVEKYRYTAFGLLTVLDAEGVEKATPALSPWLYHGRLYEQSTGLYWMRMRHYSPDLGRFLQPDPAGIAGGINLYAYSNNNPLRYFDPWGLWPAPDASGKYGEADPQKEKKRDQREELESRINEILRRAKNGELSVEDTQELMDLAASDARGALSARLRLLRNHGPLGNRGGSIPFDFAYKPEAKDIRFLVPDSINGGVMSLSGAEFGNFVAGYAGYAGLGDPGVKEMMMGGDAYELTKSGRLDNATSTTMIFFGRNEAHSFYSDHHGYDSRFFESLGTDGLGRRLLDYNHY